MAEVFSLFNFFQATSVLTAILGVHTSPVENSNRSTLEFINEKRSWKDAKAYCASTGARLVQIKTRKDQKRLDKMTENTMAWIGAKRSTFKL